MYVYNVAIIVLGGLMLVNSWNLQSQKDMSYKRVSHIQYPLAHTTVFDMCGPVALKCYEPILSYMDGDGDFCRWKDTTTFWSLPERCMNIEEFSFSIWGGNAVAYTHKFKKTCDYIRTFRECIQNNPVCRRDSEMHFVMSVQNTFCDNLQGILTTLTCYNARASSSNWSKLIYIYTNDNIIKACPVAYYRQLALNSIKLALFTYVTFPSAMTDKIAESVNAEATGRYICQVTQQDMCLRKREDKLCPGILPLYASITFDNQEVIELCQIFAFNPAKCYSFVTMNCAVNLTSGLMMVREDLADIRSIYNLTYWHTVGTSEVDILFYRNKGISHCDAGNLIFKQIGCLHRYMIQINITLANHSNYLSEYMCTKIKYYNSCFDAYINSPCADEAKQFQYIGSFLHAQCDIFRLDSQNATCPLHAVYSDVIFSKGSLFAMIMQQYVAVIKFKKMNPAPPGWKKMILNNVKYYKSLLIESYGPPDYQNDIISSVCDQEVAKVYNDFITVDKGEQYYQLRKHMIKGFEYIKYCVQ